MWSRLYGGGNTGGRETGLGHAASKAESNNYLKLSCMGVVFVDANPGFYNIGKTIAGLVEFVVGRNSRIE